MAIEYKTVTYRTVESANENATYCWVELSASHVPAVNGLIKRIVIQGATTSATGMTTDPMYLGIWERQSDGGLISLGCSKNAVVQAINQESIWDFDGAIIRGKSLLLGLLSSHDEHWTNNTQLLLRSRVQTNDTDGCVILTNIGRLKVTPDITFTVDVPEVIPDSEPEPEPEPESYSRTVDISKYWIPRIRETAEFQQIAKAINPEFNRLIECQNRLLKDGFILEATEYGVSRWEAILHRPVTAGMTLDERKEQILNRLSLKLPYTVRVLREMIAAIVGEGNFYFFIDNDTQTFHLSLTAGAMSKTDNINQLLKRVLPMNLIVDMLVDGVPTTYTQLEYLETSGTQWIQTAFCPGVTTRLRAEFDASASPEYGSVYSAQAALYVNSADSLFDATFRPNGGLIVRPFRITNWRYGSFGHAVLEVTGSSVLFNGEVMVSSYTPDSGIDDVSLMKMFTHRLVLKFYSLKTWDEQDNVLLDLIPVLNADGVPGLWDKVSKTCFYNKGTGSFGYRIKTAESDIMQLDLDDPYYTAPSAVWAKLIAENTLDIIAENEITDGESQDYKLFANVGEAYKYFNIKEVIENE